MLKWNDGLDRISIDACSFISFISSTMSDKRTRARAAGDASELCLSHSVAKFIIQQEPRMQSAFTIQRRQHCQLYASRWILYHGSRRRKTNMNDFIKARFIHLWDYDSIDLLAHKYGPRSREIYIINWLNKRKIFMIFWGAIFTYIYKVWVSGSNDADGNINVFNQKEWLNWMGWEYSNSLVKYWTK